MDNSDSNQKMDTLASLSSTVANNNSNDDGTSNAKQQQGSQVTSNTTASDSQSLSTDSNSALQKRKMDQESNQEESNPKNIRLDSSISDSVIVNASNALPVSSSSPIVSKSNSNPTIMEEKKESETPKQSRIAYTNNDSLAALAPPEAMKIPECDPAFLSLVKLEPIPPAPPLTRLTPRELVQLETSLQIGPQFEKVVNEFTWRQDWNGNLQMIEKDILMNQAEIMSNSTVKRIEMPFHEWVVKHARNGQDFTAIELLFRFIYHLHDTPSTAKRILAYTIQCPVNSIPERNQVILDAVRRISYDPCVLTQDGWTTVKADKPDGHSGGSYLIGRRIIWQGFEAIIIAFVRDEDIGDLWKCLWIDDLETFDLESDELQEGMKKWERKIQRRNANKNTSSGRTRPSIRYEANRNFKIDGIGEGIILAKSYRNRGGQPWPARILHVTEIKALGSQLSSRRSSSKNEVHVIFLAPFWNGDEKGSNPAATSQFSTGPLFELETLDVSSNTIMKYPYSTDEELSVTRLRNEFSFLGLPKAAFPRFLDAHRLAMALKLYAHTHNQENDLSDIDASATASLTDTHPLSIKTFHFPDALLNLPFDYMLQKYPDPTKAKATALDDSEDVTEPIMQLHGVLSSIAPPYCWNANPTQADHNALVTPKKKVQPLSIPDSKGLTPSISPNMGSFSVDEKTIWTVDNFASPYLLQAMADIDGKPSPLTFLKNAMQKLVNTLNHVVTESEERVQDLETRRNKLSSLLITCMSTKGQYEENVYSNALPPSMNKDKIVKEWRKTCERIFRRAIVRLSHVDSGNNVTAILTDSRCNEHITASGSFERAVRLPAALKGAKKAGAGKKPTMPLITKIEDEYLTLAEDKVLPMAHKASYLKRIKKKITSLPQDAKGVPLTDDSDGEGGEDTMGSRGSFTAAVSAVAAALKGVDMIVGGNCVNAFCAVRPPGHHAGRELRPMKAISNGFCLLNAAAAAALYAAAPRSQGGLGLKRICVIDIDLHHGNGTQDILCSTYDPRFLYVSTHVGGPHINGYQDDNEADVLGRGLRTNKNEGIFPGRCGDTSPHPGVLNIPLGKRVTASSVGTALVSQVTPAVEKFDPELIIISAGFDAHVNDPLGMGGLSAQDFGTVTHVICQMAKKSCSGRVLSILEGGYGVPCCRKFESDIFLPTETRKEIKTINLGEELPDSMIDPMDETLAKKLDKCHEEGFLHCLQEHVSSLSTGSQLEDQKASPATCGPCT